MRSNHTPLAIVRMALAACLALVLCLPAAGQPAPPATDGVPFLIRFGGTVHGLVVGAPVEIRGIRIGNVRSIGLEYLPDANSFVVSVVVELQPGLFPSGGSAPAPR